MSDADLEQRLVNLPAHGTCVEQRRRDEVWRFEAAGRDYLLAFYRRARPQVAPPRRLDPALTRFFNHQQLQKALVPALVPVAVLQGYTLKGDKGDAVLLHAPPPDAPRLDVALAARQYGDRREVLRNIADWLRRLQSAGLGHSHLTSGCFLLVNDAPVLADASLLQDSPLDDSQLLPFAFTLQPLTTPSERLWAWRQLATGTRPTAPDVQSATSPAAAPPAQRRLRANPLADVLLHRLGKACLTDNDDFGTLRAGGWRLQFVRGPVTPRAWAPVSCRHLTEDDWRRCWPTIEASLLQPRRDCFKNDPSGQVWPMTLLLAGGEVDVVVKRPLRKYWWRWLRELGRENGARRIWRNAWRLLAMGLPVEVPLLLAERRRARYVLDGLAIFARVPGQTLQQTQLDAMADDDRRRLFERLGRTLRQVRSAGLVHVDAKAWNWIVCELSPTVTPGPQPVMLDLDSLRGRGDVLAGVNRLERALRDKPDATEADIRHLRQAFESR